MESTGDSCRIEQDHGTWQNMAVEVDDSGNQNEAAES